MTIATLIKKLILEKHGIPQTILTDNGKEFVNKFMNELSNKYQFTWKYSSPYHHKTMGCVERANQTIVGKLRKLCEFGKTSWKAKLEKATAAYNISFNRAINTSPLIMKYGKYPDLCVDKKFGVLNHKVPIKKIWNERNQLFKKYAKKNIEKGKIQIKTEFSPNDKVMIYKGRKNGKFDRSWVDGFTILSKIEPDAYFVNDGKNTFRVNKDSIKKDFKN